MSENTRKVLNGFKVLTSDEKIEVAKVITEYSERSYIGDSILNEAIKKHEGLTLGPAPSSCPCCGK